MASASLGGGRYYCHLCQRSTNPTLRDSTLKCNMCDQGFVEEIESFDSDVEMPEAEGAQDLTLFSLLTAVDTALDNFTVGVAPISPSPRSRTRWRLETIMPALFTQILVNGDLNNLGFSGTPPASAADIASLPMKQLAEEDLKTHDVCSICLEKYKINEEIMTLPCLHSFHQPCLSTWLIQKGSCPICRKDIQGRDTS